jgi:hypothetical protein
VPTCTDGNRDGGCGKGRAGGGRRIMMTRQEGMVGAGAGGKRGGVGRERGGSH